MGRERAMPLEEHPDKITGVIAAAWPRGAPPEAAGLARDILDIECEKNKKTTKLTRK
jgi:hypothetical protein